MSHDPPRPTAAPGSNQERNLERKSLRMPPDPRVFNRKFERPPGRRLDIGFYEAACVLMMIFIIAGSLYPFEFDLTLPWSRLEDLSDSPGKSDLIANLALFTPLGLTAGMLRTRSAIVWTMVFAWVVAAGCQFSQIYISSRTPALWDIVFNTAGLVAGLILSRLVEHPTSRVGNRLSLVSLIIIASFLGYQLAPFNPSLDIGLLRQAIHRLIDAPWQGIGALVTGAAYVLIIAGALKAELTESFAVRIVLGLVLAVLVLKPITAASQVNPTALLGMLLALYPATRLPNDRRLFGLLGLLALALYCHDGLTPLTLRPQLVFPGLSPLPALVGGSWIANLTALMWKAFLLTAAMSLLFSAVGDETLMPMGTVLGATMLVESAQIVVASGTPSTIDIVLAIVLGAAFQRSLRSTSSRFEAYGRNNRLRKAYDQQ